MLCGEWAGVVDIFMLFQKYPEGNVVLRDLQWDIADTEAEHLDALRCVAIACLRRSKELVARSLRRHRN